VYILALIKFILLKRPADLKGHFIAGYNLELVKTNISEGNYIPFYTVKYYVTGTDPGQYSKENLIGNIILFMPLGILLPLLFCKMSSVQKIIFSALLISLTFELIPSW
jgi:glycopeptide antibiotics resistance protein